MEEQEELKKQIIEKYGFILNKSNICEILKISQPTLSRMMANCEIEYIKSQKSNSCPVRFTVESITQYVYNNTIKCFSGLE